MAILSSGIISGLDTGSLVSALMTYERAPVQRMQTQQTSVEGKISAMGKIKSALSTLQEAAKNISNSSNLYAYKGSVTNADVASVTAGKNAVAGSYKLEVEQLATYHKLTSSGAIDTTSGGTLKIQLGDDENSAVNVNIAAGASLSDIAKAINDSDAGASATVVNGTNGPQLVLTSKETGETNRMKITSDIDGLGFDPADPTAAGNMQQAVAAQNAIVKIDGIALANTTSNTITDAIEGVNLTLKATNTGNPTQIVINSDNSDMETKVQAFVDAYNAARGALKDLSKFDSTGKNNGVLNGDSTVSNAMNQLRSALSTVPENTSGAYQYLSQLGIETSSSGVLSINKNKFAEALKTDFASVAKTVSAYGSVYDRLTTEMNGTDGLIANRLDGLNASSKDLKNRIETQERRLAIVQTRYEKQFANLEGLLASFKTTENYLSQQLSSLAS
jgi:flagellar hook-associated protein 2